MKIDEGHRAAFRSALDRELSSFSIGGLTGRQMEQLTLHYLMLREWNRHVNLTRIVEPEEAARLHYAESLFGAQFMNGSRAALDIGSGAGFPAVPLAVARPGLQVVALESNSKKALFLNEAKDALELANLSVSRNRLEEIDWTAYELLTSRALDRAESIFPKLVKRLAPPLRLVLYCGPDLLRKLDRSLPPGYKSEAHSIPLAEARIVAVIRPA